MKLMNVKGSNDNLPKDEILRRKVISTLTSTFETYGYMPLDTSILCYFDLLSSKYAGGSEILKEVYTLKDQGDRNLGLRYDLTVPFSKVISMNSIFNSCNSLTDASGISNWNTSKVEDMGYAFRADNGASKLTNLDIAETLLVLFLFLFFLI